MRLFLSLLLLAAAGGRLVAADRAPTADELDLFRAALKLGEQDDSHWAYTESVTIRAKSGAVRSEQVVHYDPSKPYEEQYTPLRIDGKEPSERQKKKFRQKGLDRQKEIERRAQAAGNEEKPAASRKRRVQLDLEHPVVRAESEARLTFCVPLRPGDDSPLPVDKVEILVDLGKASRRIEHARMRVLESFRVKAVAKVKRGEMQADFLVVNPEFPSVVTRITGDLGGSILFVPLNAAVVAERTEWQRVKAFDERFSVTLAPLQTFGF